MVERILVGERGHDQEMAEDSYHVWLRRGHRGFTNIELSSEISAIIFWNSTCFRTPRYHRVAYEVFDGLDRAASSLVLVKLLTRRWKVKSNPYVKRKTNCRLLSKVMCSDVTHLNKITSTHFRQTRDLLNGRQSP